MEEPANGPAASAGMDRITAARLEEYRTLRSEILQSKLLRFTLLTALLAGFGAIAVKAASSDSRMPWQAFPLLSALGSGWVALLCAYTTRGIRETAFYIRDKIEAQVPGLGWETYSLGRLGQQPERAWSTPLDRCLAAFLLCLPLCALAIEWPVPPGPSSRGSTAMTALLCAALAFDALSVLHLLRVSGSRPAEPRV